MCTDSDRLGDTPGVHLGEPALDVPPQLYPQRGLEARQRDRVLLRKETAREGGREGGKEGNRGCFLVIMRTLRQLVKEQ